MKWQEVRQGLRFSHGRRRRRNRRLHNDFKRGIDPGVVELIKEEIWTGTNIKCREQFYLALSAEPPPSFLDLLTLGNLLKASVGLFATQYFGEWVKFLANDHIKKRKEIVAATCSKVKDGGRIIKAIAQAILRVKDARPGTCVSMAADRIKFRISMEDEDAAIDSIARSVYLLPLFKRAAEVITDRLAMAGDLSYVNAIIDDDGGFHLEWFNHDTFKRYGRKFDAEGKPIGDRYPIDH